MARIAPCIPRGFVFCVFGRAIREDLQDPAGRARGAAPKPEPDDSNESRNEVNGFSKGIFVVFLLFRLNAQAGEA